MKVEIARTKLIIPIEGGNIVFAHPAVRGNICDLEKRLKAEDLLLPTVSQQIDLFYDVVQEQEGEEANNKAREVKSLFGSGIGYVRTIPFCGLDGFYAKDCISVRENLDEEGLQKSLTQWESINGVRVKFSKDGRIRFTPYENVGYGEQKSKDFVKNGGVIVLVGRNVRKVESVADYFSINPYFWRLKNPERPVRGYVALGSRWSGSRLSVNAGCHGDHEIGFAFGVFGSAEGSALEE